MSFTTIRNGEMQTFFVSEPIPAELENYPWPVDVAEAVAASDDAWLRVNEAYSAWDDAHTDLEAVAPAKDDDALRAALRAGKPDPGTPATDLAKRAEHVAWTAFAIACEDCEPLVGAGKDAVNAYLEEHAADLAAWELARLAEYREALAKFTAAQGKMTSALDQVGNASRIMGRYVATHWTDMDNLKLAWQGDDQRMMNWGKANADLEARWTALAEDRPEPVVDIRDQSADTLATAVRFGGAPEAQAELKRRRAASRKASTD